MGVLLAFCTALPINQPNELPQGIFLKKGPCQARRDPYNAASLTGQNANFQE